VCVKNFCVSRSQTTLSAIPFALLLLIIGLLVLPVPVMAAQSYQIVLSCSGDGVAGQKTNPCFGYSSQPPGVSNILGFWIWCETSSMNPYNGQCTGSLYYVNVATGAYVAVHVEDSGPVSSSSVTVTTSDGQITCTLTPLSSNPGPTNSIAGSCSGPGAYTFPFSQGAPVSGFAGIFSNAVVK